MNRHVVLVFSIFDIRDPSVESVEEDVPDAQVAVHPAVLVQNAET